MNSHTETVTMSDSKSTANQSGFRWKWLLYVGAAIALIAAAKYFHVQDLLKQVLDWVGQLGPWGAVIFIAIYVVATVLFVPGSVLTLGAGAVFGVVWGSIYVSIAAHARCDVRVSCRPVSRPRRHRPQD